MEESINEIPPRLEEISQVLHHMSSAMRCAAEANGARLTMPKHFH